MIKITPRGKYVLVKRDEAESRTSVHGISAPTTTEQEEKAFGTIIAVGSEIKDLKPKQRVIYGAFAGEEIELDEKGKKVKYRMLEDEFVIGIIEEK